jgi:hypothetical protein
MYTETMLEVQKFLRLGFPAGTLPEVALAELTVQLGIKAKSHPVYPELIHLSYDQLESPKGHPIVRECRGLILNSADNWAVVAYPFNRFSNFGETWGDTIDWTSIRVQEKVDGCYPYSTLLNLWDGGTIKIGEVVQKHLTPDLIGMDSAGKFVKCTPTYWFNNGKKQYWLKIETDRIGESKGKLVVTPNHELFINGELQMAINAQPGDTMLRHIQSPDPATLHLIRSSLLGDGSLSSNGKTYRFATSHIKKHAEYNLFFEQSLGHFGIASRDVVSGFGSQMTQVSSISTPALTALRQEWYPKNRRKLPSDISWIDAFSLAVMYMDNGSLSHLDGQEDRATIACNFLSEEDTQRLADKIYAICGVDAVVFQSKGSNIRINASPDTFGQQVTQLITEGHSCKEVMEITGCSRSTYYLYKKHPAIYRTTAPISTFWNLIVPHIVGCMRYKLPVEFQNVPYQPYPQGQIKYEPVSVVIRNITQFEATPKTMPSGSVGYDLETTTHNYMAQGLMGHNSMCILWNYKGEWNVSTKGSPDAGGNVGDSPFTFSELFWKTMKSYGMTQFPHPGVMPSFTYILELTSIYNRVVVQHKESALTLIGVRDISAYPYPEIPVSDFFGSSAPVVKEYPLNIVSEIESAALALDPMQNEGFVVVDKNFGRVKIKSPSYVLLHHLKDGFGQRRMIRLIQLGETSEILAYFSEYQELFDEIESKINALILQIEAEYSTIKHLTDRKAFALEATKSKNSGVLFALFLGKATNVRDYILHSKKIVNKATGEEDFAFPADKIESMLGLKQRDPVVVLE